jgi:UDP-N-acetylglucosamine acyltransferase
VVIANAVLLGGHVHIGDRAFLGGGAVIHQFGRIGESVMIGGGARISTDVAPFCMAAERNTVYGLNVVGLRRRGFTREVLSEIKQAFRETFARGGNLRERAAEEISSGRYASPEARAFLEFLVAGRRTFARMRQDAAADE